jgi:hypothetical protein
MQAWINDKTGAVGPVPGSAPAGPSTAQDGDQGAAQREYDDAQATPPPKRITLKGLAVVGGAAGAAAETEMATGADMVVLPAPLPTAAATAVLAPPVVVSAGRVSVASEPAPARPQTMPQTMPQTTMAGQLPAGGEDPSFSDQVMRWMQQGDRFEEARARKPVDLADLSEPTDPVAHELFDNVPRESRTQARRRWLAIGAFAVVASIGLYWAAREPRHGDAGSAVSPSTAAASTNALARLARTPDPNAPGAILAVTPSPPVAAIAAKTPSAPASALADHGRNHRVAARLHRRRH